LSSETGKKGSFLAVAGVGDKELNLRFLSCSPILPIETSQSQTLEITIFTHFHKTFKIFNQNFTNYQQPQSKTSILIQNPNSPIPKTLIQINPNKTQNTEKFTKKLLKIHQLSINTIRNFNSTTKP